MNIDTWCGVVVVICALILVGSIMQAMFGL